MSDELMSPPECRGFRARLTVSCLMLVLGFIGLAMLNHHSRAFSLYAKVLVATYASLSIWLFWFSGRRGKVFNLSTIWHQIMLWVGLIGSLYVIDMFVTSGMMNTLAAGVVTMTLLALTTYVVGVHNDIALVFVGTALAVCAYCLAFFQTYLMLTILLVMALAVGFVFVALHYEQRQANRHAA